jgi:hypothetical protein
MIFESHQEIKPAWWVDSHVFHSCASILWTPGCDPSTSHHVFHANHFNLPVSTHEPISDFHTFSHESLSMSSPLILSATRLLCWTENSPCSGCPTSISSFCRIKRLIHSSAHHDSVFLTLPYFMYTVLVSATNTWNNCYILDALYPLSYSRYTLFTFCIWGNSVSQR